MKLHGEPPKLTVSSDLMQKVGVDVRVRIGRSYCTHCQKDPSPFSIGRNETITIEHLLTTCA